MARKRKIKRRKSKVKRKRVKKIDSEFIIFAAILIVSLAIIFGAFLYFTSQPKTEGEVNVSEVTPLPTPLPPDNRTCLERYGVDEKTVVFFYSDTCPYSIKMKPFVEQLEKEGYSFFWANIKNGTALQIVSTCLSNIASLEGTPEFICPSKNKNKVGPFASVREMEMFALECK